MDVISHVSVIALFFLSFFFSLLSSTDLWVQADSYSVWGLGDGSRHLKVNTEIITYAVLDVLAKVVFGLWLLWSHRSIPETNIEVGGYWSHGIASEGGIRLVDDDA